MTVHPTSRRALLQSAAMLTAVPVAATAGGVPVFDIVGSPELITDKTLIVRLFRQWEVAQAEEHADHGTLRGQAIETIFKKEEEIYATFGERRRAIEAAILTEPVANLRDLAIEVLVNSGEGTWALDDELTLECAALAGRDFAKMPRCLFEKEAEAA